MATFQFKTNTIHRSQHSLGKPAAVKPGTRHGNILSVKVACVANFPPLSSIPGGKEAILCQKFKAHSASVATALVIDDSEHNKRVVTSSLDKTIALWSGEGNCQELCSDGYSEVIRLSPDGGPVFSMLLDHRDDDVPDQIFLGNHAKQVVDWVPPCQQLEPNVVLEGHSGWVRALTATPDGRWLFSSGCNQLKQWDMARAVPTEVSTTTLDKGDILALAASKTMVYTAGADGSVHSFEIGKKGELTAAAAVLKAHTDRVTALALYDDLLFSCSYDGSVRAWDAITLEPAVVVENAHNNERVHCMVVGADGLLYTGGGDKLVRRWWPEVLLEAATPLYCHNQSVKALAAGRSQLVVSGDKGGEVAVWKVCNTD